MFFVFAEVFPTCADLYNFMIGKRFESEKMLDSNRDYTVDPDGAEGVDPFVVSCQFPMTVIKIGPGQSLRISPRYILLALKKCKIF